MKRRKIPSLFSPAEKKMGKKEVGIKKKHYSLCLAIVYIRPILYDILSPLVSTLNYYRYHRWVFAKKKKKNYGYNDYISTDISNLRRKIRGR